MSEKDKIGSVHFKIYGTGESSGERKRKKRESLCNKRKQKTLCCEQVVKFSIGMKKGQIRAWNISGLEAVAKVVYSTV